MSAQPEKTEAARLLTEIVLLTFRLEGGFLAAADRISAPAGLAAARRKVLRELIERVETVTVPA